MPPKPDLQGAFMVSNDAENEVVCPLSNQDGSACRKKCIGVRYAQQTTPSRRPVADFTLQEKRYRSMQEHIRRAHPTYYIPKLPATEESFQLMITTPPSAKPLLQQQQPGVPPRRGYCELDKPKHSKQMLNETQLMQANMIHMLPTFKASTRVWLFQVSPQQPQMPQWL